MITEPIPAAPNAHCGAPSPRSISVGTAGWAIPRASGESFPAEGSGLQRYASQFNAVEINSTFYCSHQPRTLERWRATTPQGFRFSIKAPRAVTHDARLRSCASRLHQFLDEIAPLAEKLGPILVQLPPSLAFEPSVAADFLGALRARWPGDVALEARHVSWFGTHAATLFGEYCISQVGADPACTGTAGVPGGHPSLAYWRLHGSPRRYYSSYDRTALEELAVAIAAARDRRVWCIFDNTTSGAAAANALALRAELQATGIQLSSAASR